MVESRVTMIKMFLTPGSVTWRKRWSGPAPSTAAASYISAGMALTPARKLIPKKGKPRQMFTPITDAIAVFGSDSQPTPWGSRWKTLTSM